jgi:hypothetical protein
LVFAVYWALHAQQRGAVAGLHVVMFVGSAVVFILGVARLWAALHSRSDEVGGGQRR